MDFDLAAYVRASTKAQGVPERLSDYNTVLAVVSWLIRAIESGQRSDRTRTLDRQELPSDDRPAKMA